MTKQMKDRLDALREEFKAGQEIFADLESRQTNVRNTLLRISGAIQVLEEILEPETPAAKDFTSVEAQPVTTQ